MTDNIEVSQWEPGIYQLEATDPVMGGLGGVDNRPPLELTNRTARIKTVLDKSGIYVVGGDHTFTGQNIDANPNIAFEGSVVDDDVVYFNTGGPEYTKALSGSHIPAGIADVTNLKMVSGGMLLHNALPSGSVAGNVVYLSDSVAGELTLTPTGDAIAKILWKTGSLSGVIELEIGVAGGAHSNLYDDEPTKHYLVGNILHSAIDNDELSIHTSLGDLIGHVALYVADSTPPTNYLECNGASISKTTYAALYTGNPFSIGTRFGDDGGNFRLPDFRGRAARGFDNGIGRDPDRLIRYADNGGVTGDTPGSMQDDQYKSHNHPPQAGSNNFQSSSGHNVNDDSGDQYGTFSNTGYSGGNETRMKNFSAMWVIRYQ